MLCAKYRSSLEEVRAVPSPEYTDSWHPISHGELIDSVISVVNSRGLQVWKSDFALMDNEKMFGVLDLQLPENIYRSDLTLSIGVRNSIDKSLSAAICVGNRVFVCDNLAFSGQVILTKKHTPTIESELPPMISAALDGFLTMFEQDNRYFDLWKTEEISVLEATDFVCQLAEQKAIHQNAILAVRQNFVTPPYPEFKDKTVWSLFNALTYYTRNQRRDASPFEVSRESQLQTSAFKRRWNLPIMIAA